MASWLSFWNEETRRLQQAGGVGHGTDADIWVPYGEGKLGRGDLVYCVAIDSGELILFGRITIGRINVDPDHHESLDVWAKRGGIAGFQGGVTVKTRAVDQLVYLMANGTTKSFARTPTGELLGSAFQGRSSIRELARGAEALERLLER
jgi:hypothetical protein